MPKPRFKIKPKYSKPKILLLDLESDCTESLGSAGYNVRSGSFGIPYRVKAGDGFLRVAFNSELPNFSEQEIIVADLEDPPTVEQAPAGPCTDKSVPSWWTQANTGFINPRPLVMSLVSDDARRIYHHGGLFVFFSAPRRPVTYRWGHVVQLDLVGQDEAPDNWSLLPSLGDSSLRIHADRGEELSIIATGSLSRLLSEYIPDTTYTCVFSRNYNIDEERWFPLAHNKYGKAVAAAIVPSESAGWVFLLPRIVDQAGFVQTLLTEVLPGLAPRLFPHSRAITWVKEPEYELPNIRRLRQRIEGVHSAAQREIASVKEEVERERDSIAFLFQILSESGTALVQAVNATLGALGFAKVVDMDRELEEGGATGPKREDLQIRDRSPLLLIEVKGIESLPREAASLQCWKYVAPRMKELDRTDIQSLSIINHQRHLPPLDRENTNPFQDDVVENAQQHGFGLLTTWDLHRLARSYIQNHWKPEHVQELFYEVGRITPVPKHYCVLGVVDKHWPKASAVSVRLESEQLRLHDRIALELPACFEEFQVGSMQIDGSPVQVAHRGDVVGVAVESDLGKIREGVRVFHVIHGWRSVEPASGANGPGDGLT